VLDLGIEGFYNLSSLKIWECPVLLGCNVSATPILFVIDRDVEIIGKALTMMELK
jgi:hypothetical protein